MRKMIAEQVQLGHHGFFSRPVFPRLDQNLLETLFAVFSECDPNLTVADIRQEWGASNLGDCSFTVHLFNYSANYKFKVDRIEARFNDFTEDQLSLIPQVLQSGDRWLRSLDSQFSFRMHLFTHSSHNRLSEGTSEEFLKSLSSIDIPDIGTNRGHGILFNWLVGERNWNFQLSIDHSLQITDGLFLQLLFRMADDKIDHKEAFEGGLKLGRSALAKIGLEV